MKIIGGINAGVKTFLFPTENKKDYDKFIEKYEGNTILTGIRFITVDTIHEAIKYALIKKSDSSNLCVLKLTVSFRVVMALRTAFSASGANFAPSAARGPSTSGRSAREPVRC